MIPSCALGVITAIAIWIMAAEFAGSDWVGGLLAVIVALIVAAAVYQLQIRRIRSSLRHELRRLLAGDRLPVCLTCGYDLAGTDSPRCPECGAPADVPQPVDE